MKYKINNNINKIKYRHNKNTNKNIEINNQFCPHKLQF